MRFGLILSAMLMAVPANAALNVVASMPDYAALAKAVGGDHVSVKALASESQDPHFVDAKPSYVLALNRADLVVVNGLELEIGWIPSLLMQARNPKVVKGAIGYFDVGRVVKNILEVPTGTLDRSMGDIHPGGNPHYSHDPVRMLDVVDALAQRMSQLDPANAVDFEAGRLKTRSELEALIGLMQARFRSLPDKSRRVVEYHKGFAYLFDTLGIEVVTRIEPKPGVAPSPAHVARVVSLMKREGIRVVAQENYTPTKVSKTIASITKSTHLALPSGTRFEGGESYLAHIQVVMELLYDACKKGAGS